MTDYTLYIAGAWLLTAFVLGGLVAQTLWRAKKAERDTSPDADA